jgi:hypothetical protein
MIDIGFILTDGEVNFVNIHGDLWVFYGPFPIPTNCSLIEGKIEGGIVEQVNEKLRKMQFDEELKTELQNEIGNNLDPADLAEGPLSTVDVNLPNGLGFQLNTIRYVATKLPGHIGGDVFMSRDGLNLAASFRVADKGGGRFPFSYVPSTTRSVVQETYSRSRPTGGPFDIGLILSGATVNQLSRALTAGELRSPIVAPPPCCIANASARLGGGVLDPVDVGLLDQNTTVRVGTQDVPVSVFPSVPPLYLPTPPTGWPATGNVNLMIPSLRIGINFAGVGSMATDVRVGVNAFIDGTNHLVPLVQGSDVRARFLRLSPSVNQLTDPTEGGVLGAAATKIQETVPRTVAQVLRPVELPDLSAATGGVPVHLENLTIGTVGGGHFGAFIDVAPGAPASAYVRTTFAAPVDGPPTSFTATASPPASPLVETYRYTWTVRDQNTGTVVYQSPQGGEVGVSKTFPGSLLSTQSDPCTGERYTFAQITVVISDGAYYSETQTGGGGHIWAGPPPTNPPSTCEPPPPDEEPPDDDPIPPICINRPWLCEGEEP